MMRLQKPALPLALAALSLLGCNRHVFEPRPRQCVQEQLATIALATAAPLDLLFVVDNSASMAEEQQALVEAFYDERCPFGTDASPGVPEAERNPTDERLAELGEVCGFVQLLATFDRDVRVGVITTDVGQCDNRFGQAPAGWGRRPQRGCLQAPDGAERRFLRSDDENLGGRFRDTLARVGVYGSSYERGLDAAALFLDPEAERAPGCEDDLDDFLRQDAELALIFLTDEDDCSHGGPPADFGDGFDDENVAGHCDAELEAPPTWDPQDCYARADELTSVAHYAEAFRAAKRGGGRDDVRVAVVGGAARVGGELVPGGCVATADGPDAACYPSLGLSNYDGPGQPCHPETLAAAGIDEVCCEADGSDRYFALGEQLGADFRGDSLCAPDFRRTLSATAAFLGRTDGLRLAEPPPNPAAIVVSVERADGTEEDIPRAPDGEPADDDDGWRYEGDGVIRFVGPSAPGPGDVVTARALADRGEAECLAPTGPAGS
jgi:hypothetical protein